MDKFNIFSKLSYIYATSKYLSEETKKVMIINLIKILGE